MGRQRLRQPLTPASLAKELEFPDAPDTDYNLRPPPAGAAAITSRIVSDEQLAAVTAYMDELQA